MPEITLTGVLVAGYVPMAGALVYVFKRMETLVKRSQDREDKMLAALLGRMGDDEDGAR